MKEWEKELYIYRLQPAPPPKDDLQDYINLYLAENNEQYLAWFLHYYEPRLNTTAMGIVQRYAMYGHLIDIKSVCVVGIVKALQSYTKESGVPFLTYKTCIMWREIHDYIRTMRTGTTMQSDDEYRKCRKAMAMYNKFGRKADFDTIVKIAAAIGETAENTKEILQGAILNMHFTEFYRIYDEEDDDQGNEDVTCDYSMEPSRVVADNERRQAVFGAWESLPYREREFIRSHIGFCPKCHSLKSPNYPKLTFQEIAYRFELKSPDAAEDTYRKGLDRLIIELTQKGYVHCIRLKRKQKTAKKLTYLYQVDNEGDCGEICYDFKIDTFDITTLAELDITKTKIYAKFAIQIIKGMAEKDNFIKDRYWAVKII